MNAREYFESIRDEVRGINSARETLERLMAREGANAQSYDASSGGGYADPMDAINGRIDFEGRLRARIADCGDLTGEAYAVLYGIDGKGGLAKFKGRRYAEAVDMGYCQAMPWADVADIMRCSRQWCQELCRAAFRCIDAVGFAELKEI